LEDTRGIGGVVLHRGLPGERIELHFDEDVAGGADDIAFVGIAL
jgi:hypothetical protein